MVFVGNHGIIDARIELALKEDVFRETLLTTPVGCTPDTEC